MFRNPFNFYIFREQCLRFNDLHISDISEVVIHEGFKLVVCKRRKRESTRNFFHSIFREIRVPVLILLNLLVVERDAFGFTWTHRQCEIVIGIVPLYPAPSTIAKRRLNPHTCITAAIRESANTNRSRLRVQDRDPDARSRSANKEPTPLW